MAYSYIDVEYKGYEIVPKIISFSVHKIVVMIQCSKCLSKELTLVLSDTRKLDRVSNTK